jgi:ADP-heptose:LPS heptosyltransferase
MKILIVGLARLGDIYLTWPAVRALKRLNPESHITYLTREKFRGALEGLESVDQIRSLSTRLFVEPLFTPECDIKAAHQAMSEFTSSLKDEHYDWILNFSFSPFSSYLVHAVSNPETRVTGYTRFEDGYLRIPDDMSAYFYAQVGVKRSNRFHLAEVFATMAGADLVPSDWREPVQLPEYNQKCPILFHIGASESHKSLSPEKWIAVINQFLKTCEDHVGLIGSASEFSISEKIMASTPTGRVVNFTGQTTLGQTFRLISDADLLVGCDSAPMHMASLVKTPSLNISMPTVNFWETGPRAPGSYVFRVQNNEDIPSDRIAQVILKMRNGERQDLSVYPVCPHTPSYRALCTKEADFQWSLLKAIYMTEDFPESQDPIFLDGMSKLADINGFMIEQLEAFKKSRDFSKHAAFIDRGEEIINTIAQLVPSLAILIRWYQTEKSRLGPESQEIVLEKTISIHQMLQKVCRIYLDNGAQKQEEQNHENGRNISE